MSSAERASDPALVVLDTSALRDVRERIRVAGPSDCDAFVVVDLGDRGLSATVVDAESGVRVGERTDSDLAPRMLDRAVVDHLTATGRVARPESDEWADELLGLVTGLRGTLVTAEGAFAMGAEHVGLVRVSRSDLVVALHPYLMTAAALWQSVVSECARTVGALVFLPGHRQWPGLFQTLAQHASIPAVAVEDADVTAVAERGRGRHGVAVVASEPAASEPAADEPVVPDDPGADGDSPVATETEPLSAPVEPTPVFESMSLPAEPPAVPPTPVVPPMQSVPPMPAQPHQPPLVSPPTMPPFAPMAPEAFGNPSFPTANHHDAFFGPGGEREPISVHDNRDVRDSGGPRHYSPPAPVADTTSPEARRVHNRRLLIGTGAVAGAAALGIIVLTLPWIDQGRSVASGQVNAAQTGTPPAVGTSEPSSTQPPRPPLDLGAARLPVTQYTAPPPAAPPTAQAAPRRSRPAPRARPRSIPNPIPGLPPILLP